MVPHAGPEGGPEAFAVAEAVFPGAGTGGGDDLDQHAILEDGAEAELGEERGGKAEVLDANDVEEVEHPVHAEYIYNTHPGFDTFSFERFKGLLEVLRDIIEES